MIGPSVGMLFPGLGLDPVDVTCLKSLILKCTGWKEIQMHPEPGLQEAGNVEETGVLAVRTTSWVSKGQCGFPLVQTMKSPEVFSLETWTELTSPTHLVLDTTRESVCPQLLIGISKPQIQATLVMAQDGLQMMGLKMRNKCASVTCSWR